MFCNTDHSKQFIDSKIHTLKTSFKTKSVNMRIRNILKAANSTALVNIRGYRLLNCIQREVKYDENNYYLHKEANSRFR